MTREEARTQLAAMVDAAADPVLDENDLNTALTFSRIPDEEGRPPTDPDYVETFDLYWAAAECMLIRHRRTLMQGGKVTEFTSEGSRFKVEGGADWLALARYWRDQSPLATPGQIGVIEIDTGQDFIPQSAAYPRPGGPGYCDVDYL